MYCNFPYFEQRPHIPIRVLYQGKGMRLLPLLDSGADFCVFSKRDAIRIGLDWEQGQNICLEDAGGESFIAKQFLLDLEIEKFEFRARVCFIDNDAIPLSQPSQKVTDEVSNGGRKASY